MTLTCKSCSHDFSIDEHNLDTEKVECPHCQWPILVYRARLNRGYFGRFTRTTNIEHRQPNLWPRTEFLQ